jgi:hypothetical protein
MPHNRRRHPADRSVREYAWASDDGKIPPSSLHEVHDDLPPLPPGFAWTDTELNDPAACARMSIIAMPRNDQGET